MKNRGGAARDVKGIVDLAEEIGKDPLENDVLNHGRNHDEERHGDIGYGQTQQDVIGRVLKLLVADDNRHDECVTDHS